jgi:type I restriction enzyme S subunit
VKDEGGSMKKSIAKKYKPYPAYKDSGVEWLGEIPEGWSSIRAQAVFCRNDGGFWGEDPKDDGTDTVIIRSTEQDMDGNWQIKDPAQRSITDREKKQTLLCVGDLVVTKSSGSELHIGKTSIVDSSIAELQCCYSNFMQRLRVNDLVRPKWIYYYYNNAIVREQLKFYSSSTIGLANLNASILGLVEIALPAIGEQQAILRCLDCLTSKIDALLAKYGRLLTLLAEKRSALISRAVTKGLDSDTPMKDSGVEWYSTIPQHWKISKMKYISWKIGSGKTPSGGSEVYQSEGIMILRSQNIHFDGLHLDDVAFIDEKTDSEMGNSRVHESDVLLNITGASIGRCCVARLSNEKANVNQHVCIIRPVSEKIAPDFLSNSIASHVGQEQILTIQDGISREGLNFDQVGNMNIVLPPLDEQEKIAESVAAERTKIDSLVAKVERAVELLKEYRIALISAAVTGKIDLREESA